MTTHANEISKSKQVFLNDNIAKLEETKKAILSKLQNPTENPEELQKDYLTVCYQLEKIRSIKKFLAYKQGLIHRLICMHVLKHESYPHLTENIDIATQNKLIEELINNIKLNRLIDNKAMSVVFRASLIFSVAEFSAAIICVSMLNGSPLGWGLMTFFMLLTIASMLSTMILEFSQEEQKKLGEFIDNDLISQIDENHAILLNEENHHLPGSVSLFLENDEIHCLIVGYGVKTQCFRSYFVYFTALTLTFIDGLLRADQIRLAQSVNNPNGEPKYNCINCNKPSTLYDSVMRLIGEFQQKELFKLHLDENDKNKIKEAIHSGQVELDSELRNIVIPIINKRGFSTTLKLEQSEVILSEAKEELNSHFLMMSLS